MPLVSDVALFVVHLRITGDKKIDFPRPPSLKLDEIAKVVGSIHLTLLVEALKAA